MTKKAILNTIKSTVLGFLPDARVLLFGSRANGNYTNDSDYDVLVVTNKTFQPKIKITWESKISKALINSLDAPFDVILQSKKEISSNKKLQGHIAYYALQDAVEL